MTFGFINPLQMCEDYALDPLTSNHDSYVERFLASNDDDCEGIFVYNRKCDESCDLRRDSCGLNGCNKSCDHGGCDSGCDGDCG